MLDQIKRDDIKNLVQLAIDKKLNDNQIKEICFELCNVSSKRIKLDKNKFDLLFKKELNGGKLTPAQVFHQFYENKKLGDYNLPVSFSISEVNLRFAPLILNYFGKKRGINYKLLMWNELVKMYSNQKTVNSNFNHYFLISPYPTAYEDFLKDPQFIKQVLFDFNNNNKIMNSDNRLSFLAALRKIIKKSDFDNEFLDIANREVNNVESVNNILTLLNNMKIDFNNIDDKYTNIKEILSVSESGCVKKQVPEPVFLYKLNIKKIRKSFKNIINDINCVNSYIKNTLNSEITYTYIEKGDDLINFMVIYPENLSNKNLLIITKLVESCLTIPKLNLDMEFEKLNLLDSMDDIVTSNKVRLKL